MIYSEGGISIEADSNAAAVEKANVIAAQFKAAKITADKCVVIEGVAYPAGYDGQADCAALIGKLNEPDAPAPNDIDLFKSILPKKKKDSL